MTTTKKVSRPSPLPEYTNTQGAMAIMNCSAAKLAQHTQNGVVPKASHNTYHTLTLLRAAEALNKGLGVKKDIEAQKAQKLKRENALAEGQVISMAKVLMLAEDLTTIFTTVMRAVPGRCAGSLDKQPASVIEERLVRECNYAIFEAKKRLGEFAGVPVRDSINGADEDHSAENVGAVGQPGSRSARRKRRARAIPV